MLAEKKSGDLIVQANNGKCYCLPKNEKLKFTLAPDRNCKNMANSEYEAAEEGRVAFVGDTLFHYGNYFKCKLKDDQKWKRFSSISTKKASGVFVDTFGVLIYEENKLRAFSFDAL